MFLLPTEEKEREKGCWGSSGHSRLVLRSLSLFSHVKKNILMSINHFKTRDEIEPRTLQFLAAHLAAHPKSHYLDLKSLYNLFVNVQMSSSVTYQHVFLLCVQWLSVVTN